MRKQAQRGADICPKAHSREVAEQGAALGLISHSGDEGKQYFGQYFVMLGNQRGSVYRHSAVCQGGESFQTDVRDRAGGAVGIIFISFLYFLK